jgi:AraC-like DNA-binding protein
MDASMPARTSPLSGRPPERLRRIRSMRLAAVLRDIDQRSGDPSLDPAAVAVKLCITPRYVHMLLKETGRTFGRHLLEKRLEKAAALLGDPHCPHRKISDIAAQAGFSDLSHFSRAFRRRYGRTPSDVRREAVREDPPPAVARSIYYGAK